MNIKIILGTSALLTVLLIGLLIRSVQKRQYVGLAVLLAITGYTLYGGYVSYDYVRIMTSDTARISCLDSGRIIEVDTAGLMTGISGAITHRTIRSAAGGSDAFEISYYKRGKHVISSYVVTVSEPDAADEYLYRTLDDRWVVTRVRGRFLTYEQVFYDNLAEILAIGAEH